MQKGKLHTSESVSFLKSQLEHNFDCLEKLVSDLSLSGCSVSAEKNGTRVWRQVGPGLVIDFLSSIEVPPDNRRCRGELLSRYIEQQVQNDELTNWTVALLSSSKGKRKNIAGRELGLIERVAVTNTDTTFTIKKVVSPVDETIDLSEVQKAAAMAESRAHRIANELKDSSNDVPLSWTVRKQRTKDSALLLLYPLDPVQFDSKIPAVGFAVCFPGSPTASKVSYVVNNIYWEQEFGS